MPYSSVSGLCSCSRASASHSGCSSAFWRLNRLFSNNSAGSSLLKRVRTTSAVGLILRRNASTLPSCISSSKSILLTKRTLANSSWSQSKLATVLSSSVSACQPRSASLSTVPNCSKIEAASTTVTRLYRLATSPRLPPVTSSRKVNVSATGRGSDIPEDSISTWSKRRSAARDASDVSKSSRKVQQIQPLESSTIRSSSRNTLP
mmetsp:Transcript_30104/g.80340  ORF Transcript_30104/g.80340 Transcript_30104/m.80340 type:complete len:205 (-) Transcript_30104:1907-2521(-)